MRKKKETKLECYEDKCGKFELTIPEDAFNGLPKERHIYTAKCSTCKRVMAVKAKDFPSFGRVFGEYKIVYTKSTLNKFFTFK